MSWAGCYDLTLSCDSDEHKQYGMYSQTFNDEHGSKCRARALKAGWTFWPDGRALCPEHKDEKLKPCKCQVVESVPGATRCSLSLASNGKSVFWRPEEFVESAWLAPNPYGSGTSLPTLYVDDEYVCRFKFEKAARVSIWMAGPVLKDSNAKLPR